MARKVMWKGPYVLTDASDAIWSGFVTRVPFEDGNRSHIDNRHESSAFLSGCFNSTQLRWSILEQEACSIIATTKTIQWLLADRAGFDLHIYQDNLVFTFDPVAILRDIFLISLKKVVRWAVRLSVYNYTFVCIPGVENISADLVSRWAVPNTVMHIVNVPVLTSAELEDFQ